ncbi:MAG: hypothetical protein KAT32_04270 [Candidatus Moranbacteria bacterium]|nr:hypothetical protein [Candidatus Moranbacteria bacterium]
MTDNRYHKEAILSFIEKQEDEISLKDILKTFGETPVLMERTGRSLDELCNEKKTRKKGTWCKYDLFQITIMFNTVDFSDRIREVPANKNFKPTNFEIF